MGFKPIVLHLGVRGLQTSPEGVQDMTQNGSFPGSDPGSDPPDGSRDGQMGPKGVMDLTPYFGT